MRVVDPGREAGVGKDRDAQRLGDKPGGNKRQQPATGRLRNMRQHLD